MRCPCPPLASQSRIASAALTRSAAPPTSSSTRINGYLRRPGIRNNSGAVTMTPAARYLRNRTPAADPRNARAWSALIWIRSPTLAIVPSLPALSVEYPTVLLLPTKDQIKSAPEFDENTYMSREYRDRIGTYYGTMA